MALTLNVTLKEIEPEQITVEVRNPDRVRWDMAATRNGWPTFDKAPFLGMTYLAWAALKREGQYQGTWDEFKDSDCVDVESHDVEDADALGK